MIMKNKITILLVVLLSILINTVSFSQTNTIHNLTESNTNSNARTASPANSITSYPTHLLYDLQSSVYIEDNTIISVNGVTSPKVLKLKDTQSFEIIKNRNKLYKDVEMITINLKDVSDLSTAFDVDSIRGFNHLKYIYIKSDFNLTENQIIQFIINADPEISIFYKNIDRS